jgi:hypothetical protein
MFRTALLACALLALAGCGMPAPKDPASGGKCTEDAASCVGSYLWLQPGSAWSRGGSEYYKVAGPTGDPRMDRWTIPPEKVDTYSIERDGALFIAPDSPDFAQAEEGYKHELEIDDEKRAH